MGRSSVIDLLGPYVGVPPCDLALRDGSVPGTGAVDTASDDLHLETGVVSRSPLVRRRRSCTGACSVVLHSVGLVAAFAVPLLLSSALPEPAGTVHAFLAEPLSLPPPPPPPAPAPRTAPAPVRTETAPGPTTSFVAPIEVPTELRPEEGLDLGIEGGVSGGVEGGVPGGVVGAIVGGLPDWVAEAPPPMQPIRVGSGLVHEPSKLKHVAPVYPAVAVAARAEGSVIVEASIDERGRVTDVRVVQGNSLFDKAALEAVRQWVYSPTLLDGVPVRVLMTITVHFQLTPDRRVRGGR